MVQERKKRRGLLVLSIFLSSAIVSWGASAHAAPAPSEVPSRGAADVSPEVARKAAAISRQTMSPFCPGRTLSDCPSAYATEWRRDIRAMVKQGMSASEIQKTLEARAAGNLSGIPNRKSSYVLPLGLAFGAAMVLFLLFSRLRRHAGKDEKADVAAGEAEGTPGDQEDEPGKNSDAVDDERLRAELDAEN